MFPFMLGDIDRISSSLCSMMWFVTPCMMLIVFSHSGYDIALLLDCEGSYLDFIMMPMSKWMRDSQGIELMLDDDALQTGCC